MKACFVCATAWDPHAETCAKCGTTQQLLLELQQRAKQHRFLFGRSAPPKAEQEPEAPLRPQVKKAPVPKPKPKSKPPIIREPDIFPTSDDIILERDRIDTRSTSPSEPRWENAIVLALDLFLCLLLDLAVFKLVLWISQRSFMPLVNFSLIPIFFVLLGFTILYFWLFINLFGRTLGRILATHYWDR